MSKFFAIPVVTENLYEYWTAEYGVAAACFLVEYVPRMAIEIDHESIPFDFHPIIEFNLEKTKKHFSNIPPGFVETALLLLKDERLLRWRGKLEDCEYLIFINHETLLYDLFEREF